MELSRRKVLAGLGTIGVASAGVGLGTSAYFSDVETFTNNRLVAGSLDLTLDWEEHYSDWSDDEAEGLQYPVLMDDPGEDAETTYVGFPDPENPMVYIAQEDIQTFQDNTALEAYPDGNNDGIQDPVVYQEGDESQYVPCEDFAQMPEDLDPSADGSLRTLNQDTYDNEAEEYKPLVSLEDVKPGDFGELTLSYHLCDNPGYVWLTGGLVEASENGVTEPEMKDPDEDYPEGDTVELLDAVQTMLWYDEDGDNVYEPGGVSGAADIILVLDDSGSMSGGGLSAAQDAAIQLIDTVGGNAQFGVVGFDSQARMDQPLTMNKQDARDAVNALTANGRTNIEEAIDIAHEELDGHDVATTYDASGNHRDDAQPIIVLLTDGAPNEGYESQTLPEPGHDDDNEPGDPFWSEYDEANPADNAEYLKQEVHDVTMYTVGFGGISAGSTSADLLEYMATDDASSFIGAQDELFEIFSQIAQEIAGEEAFFRGSLRELLDTLGMGSNGIPLDGNRTTAFDEVPGDDIDAEAPSDPASDARECFVNSTTNALGLAWWLPVDHANEIQTDSVTFDLGFYTEQCRHNDGAGMQLE